MYIHSKKILFFFALLVTVAMACSKKDILPEEVGEPVPYVPDATRNWQQVMNDPEFSLFKAAWSRSKMDSLVRRNNSAFHTVFMPVNTAFEAAGWNSDKINATASTDLDSLLRYYVVVGRYTSENIALPSPRPYLLNTMAVNPRVTGATVARPYVYRFYVSAEADSLVINGKGVGLMSKSEEALNGQVYKLEKMVTKPKVTLIEYIRSEPRFSMLLAAINASTPYYTYPANYNNPQWITKMGNGVQSRPTLFLPTNRAFSNSGFNTIADIQAFIAPSTPVEGPFYDENRFYLYPTTSMDSLLNAHGFSVLMGGFSTLTWDNIFFYRDLKKNPATLSGYLLQPGQFSQEGNVMMKTVIKTENNRVMVGSFYNKNAPFQAIAEADIECLNGIIHVVDDFILKP
jgi:uncharacterized surface protein with fasciclin (FAS1) repeats